MSTVTPILDRLSPEQVVAHQDTAIRSLAVKLLDMRTERDFFRSTWEWEQKRREGMQVRRLQLVIGGMLAGALVAWVLDGEIAQKIDHLLRTVGL